MILLSLFTTFSFFSYSFPLFPLVLSSYHHISPSDYPSPIILLSLSVHLFSLPSSFTQSPVPSLSFIYSFPSPPPPITLLIFPSLFFSSFLPILSFTHLPSISIPPWLLSSFCYFSQSFFSSFSQSFHSFPLSTIILGLFLSLPFTTSFHSPSSLPSLSFSLHFYTLSFHLLSYLSPRGMLSESAAALCSSFAFPFYISPISPFLPHSFLTFPSSSTSHLKDSCQFAEFLWVHLLVFLILANYSIRLPSLPFYGHLNDLICHRSSLPCLR